VNISEARAIPDSADQLASIGVMHLPALCTDEFVQRILRVSERRIREVMAALGNRDIGIGSAAGYDEIVQRSPGRWDVPISPEQLGIHDRDLPWWPLVAAVLGEDAEHSFSGVVFSEPGSPAQCWHIDSPHLDAEHLAPHALNIMVALHDIQMDMGPTEFALGSHVLTNHLRNPGLVRDELVYQHAGTSPELLVDGNEHHTPARWADGLTAGSCLVFDDRIMHRGLANHSARKRFVAYFSYRKKAYSENTHFESRRSVFAKD
jgi:hypothetical protein